MLAQVVSRLTEYYTSTETAPVQDIAEAARTGPATTVLSGIASGLESTVYAVIAIAVALGVAIGLGDGNIQFTFYLVALTGLGMLATTGVVVSEDTFGPVSDNAAGIAEMSGEFDGEAERIMVSLDAVGNTTKAITKGFAIGSAVIAAVALFASFIEVVGDELGLPKEDLFSNPLTQINVADPKTFIGLLIGGSVAFMFSSLAIRAVGRTAGTVVQEVRRQFREHPGIMDYTERPEYGRVIDICTAASLRELATPALLAVLTPVIIGFGISYLALGAFLAAVILTGQLMAVFLSNAGGAWDNAKKYIEDGHEGGKGSEAHKAAVIGDTVGDPFKDTAGPALNPLIKVMNLVSLLMLPAVISLQDNDAARYAIAAVSILILAGALAFSKRKATPMDEVPDDHQGVARRRVRHSSSRKGAPGGAPFLRHEPLAASMSQAVGTLPIVVNSTIRAPVGIVFDGDDTLWQTERLYDDARQRAADVVAAAGIDPSAWERIQRRVDVENVAVLGHTMERFPTSCVQAYEETCRDLGLVADPTVAEQVRLAARSVFENDAAVFPGARATLMLLRAGGARLALLTKGDPHVQRLRIDGSGLRDLFDVVVIVPDKTPDVIRAVVLSLGSDVGVAWMVGNSVRSDIAPALAAGLRAVWIDAHVWEYERAHDHLVEDRVIRASALDELPELLSA